MIVTRPRSRKNTPTHDDIQRAIGFVRLHLAEMNIRGAHAVIDRFEQMMEERETVNKWDMPLEDAGVPAALAGRLDAAGLMTLGDIAGIMPGTLKKRVDGIARYSIDLLESILAEHGMYFGMSRTIWELHERAEHEMSGVRGKR